MIRKLNKPGSSSTRSDAHTGVEVNDNVTCRDILVLALEKANKNLDRAYVFLVDVSSKVDYQKYGEVMFEVLIVGGVLLSEGSISMDGESRKTDLCVFSADQNMETMKGFENIFLKLLLKYKYLHDMFEVEMLKLLNHIRSFGCEERIKLARLTALMIINGKLSSSVLVVLINEDLVKENLAFCFILEVFVTFKNEVDVASLINALKIGRLDERLLEFLPANRRTEEQLAISFNELGLDDLLMLKQLHPASPETSRLLNEALINGINCRKSMSDIASLLTDIAMQNDTSPLSIMPVIWSTIMERKEECQDDTSLTYLVNFVSLFDAFTTTVRGELLLLNTVQKYCYEKEEYSKLFLKIVLWLHNMSILNLPAINLWYKEAHLPLGKKNFRDQLSVFMYYNSPDSETESD